MQATINTQEIWKGKKAVDAFEIMENTTSILLSNRDLTKEKAEMEIAVVDEFGGSLPNANF